MVEKSGSVSPGDVHIDVGQGIIQDEVGVIKLKGGVELNVGFLKNKEAVDSQHTKETWPVVAKGIIKMLNRRGIIDGEGNFIGEEASITRKDIKHTVKEGHTVTFKHGKAGKIVRLRNKIVKNSLAANSKTKAAYRKFLRLYSDLVPASMSSHRYTDKTSVANVITFVRDQISSRFDRIRGLTDGTKAIEGKEIPSKGAGILELKEEESFVSGVKDTMIQEMTKKLGKVKNELMQGISGRLASGYPLSIAKKRSKQRDVTGERYDIGKDLSEKKRTFAVKHGETTFRYKAWGFSAGTTGKRILKPDITTGTSHRLEGGLKADDLKNFYIASSSSSEGSPDIIARHGVIENEQQYMEYVHHMTKLVKMARQKSPEKPVRIINRSLLTDLHGTPFKKAGDSDMLKKQAGLLKDQSYRVIASLKDVELVHINIATNTMSRIPIVSEISERRSMTASRRGWLQLTKFVLEDVLKAFPSLEEPDEKSTLGEYAVILDELSGKLQDGEVKASVDILRELLKYQFLDVDRRKYKEACDKNSDLHDLWATKAKNTAIRSRKELSRNGEHLMLSMLLKNLGCVETINCKSGCDRTSIVHMMSTALSQMLQEAKDDSEKCEAITKMACNFDKLTVELDKHIATAEEWKAYVESLTEATDHKSEQLLLAAELRNVIAKHSEAAQLVAFFSTGRRGLKYGGVHVQKGFGKIKTNPHVAKMFPPYITLADGNTLKIKDGHDKFTEEGSRWIQDSSQQRGG